MSILTCCRRRFHHYNRFQSNQNYTTLDAKCILQSTSIRPIRSREQSDPGHRFLSNRIVLQPWLSRCNSHFREENFCLICTRTIMTVCVCTYTPQHKARVTLRKTSPRSNHKPDSTVSHVVARC